MQRLSEAARFEPISVQVELLSQALPLFERAGDAWGSATAVLDSAYLLSIVGGPGYREMLERARALAEERGDPRTRASVLRTEAFHAYFSRRFATAVRLARRARPLGAETGDRWLEVEALLVEASARPRPSRPRPQSRWSRSCSRSPAPPAPTTAARWR